MPINLKTSASASGTRNLFNPLVVATETSVFGMSKSDPTQYNVPGNGNPAVSTSAYYNVAGLYNFRPYDLDTMGATGASVKAANGGRRYVWVTSADHPVFSYSWVGNSDFFVGYSHQPWDFPKIMREIIPTFNAWNSTGHPLAGDNYTTYQYPFIWYNPDDPDGLPIYLFAETGPAHYTGLWRSADFVTFTAKEVSHYHDPAYDQYTSFTYIAKKNGTNSYTTMGLSGVGPTTNGTIVSLWNSTDGINYTSAFTPITDTVHFDGVFAVGSQSYVVGREDAAGGGLNQYVTISPVDSSSYTQGSTKYRMASGWGNTQFPGPLYLQGAPSYIEDGVLYILPVSGFANDVDTPAGAGGRGGAPYANGGGLDYQFLDKLVVRVDDASARQSAPVGMGISCTSGTATITWKNALPQNTYRLYRGTDATTQATLIGDYSGVTSATDSPTTGRYWYKLVTLDSGTERKSRVLSVYVSSSASFVNEHIDRILDDGADVSTINRPFLDRMNTLLDTVSIRNNLELFTHPACGVNTTESPIKIYDLGTTRLPRSDDFKALTTSTTYSSTAVNTGPGWTNSVNNAYGYWGDLKRGNTIQKKRQISIIVAYERTQTTEDFTFIGTGPIWGNTADGNKILALKHTAGTPGNIEFSLSDETSTKTATVTASGSGLQIAIGTYDGTSMLAYTGSTAGTAVTTLDPNAEFGKNGTTNLNDGIVFGSLAGARMSGNNGSRPATGSSPFPMYYPFLGSGSVHNYVLRRWSVSDVRTHTETNAKGKIQCIIVLDRAVNSTEIGTIITELQSTANW